MVDGGIGVSFCVLIRDFAGLLDHLDALDWLPELEAMIPMKLQIIM